MQSSPAPCGIVFIVPMSTGPQKEKKGFMRFVKKYGFISMRKNFFTFLEESEARARERQRARSTEIESES